MEPYTYLASVPGKEVRSALMAAFNEWMRVNDEDLSVVKKLVGMLHTASLLSVSCRRPIVSNRSLMRFPRSPVQHGRRGG